jgi:hypothetical protein
MAIFDVRTQWNSYIVGLVSAHHTQALMILDCLLVIRAPPARLIYCN